jgi:hypothetical protein
MASVCSWVDVVALIDNLEIYNMGAKNLNMPYITPVDWSIEMQGLISLL